MMRKTVALAALCGLAQIGRAEVQAFANVSAGDTSPGVATIMAEVTGTGDVFAEYAYDRANHFRSAKDCYVTNGLIAMWDGIDNMGRGSHVTGATTWRDLVGGHLDVTFTAPPTVGANYYQLTQGGAVGVGACRAAARGLRRGRHFRRGGHGGRRDGLPLHALLLVRRRLERQRLHP